MMKRHGRPNARVLIVDDEPTVCEFVKRVLADAGYQTAVAGRGQDALRLCEQRGPFDLLVTDLMMPGMYGDELARLVRCSAPAIKVLYLTGYSDRLFQERAELCAGEAFLDKPTGIDALLEAVALLLGLDVAPPPPRARRRRAAGTSAARLLLA